MRITFDRAKGEATLRERGIDFRDALHVFDGPTLEVEDRRRDYGEVRMLTVGFLAGRMVMVVWTPREGARRIISMRKCNAKEQARYLQRLKKA
jgi:uncharacterized protein